MTPIDDGGETIPFLIRDPPLHWIYDGYHVRFGQDVVPVLRDGLALRSFLPGRRATVLFTGFAPLFLLVLAHSSGLLWQPTVCRTTELATTSMVRGDGRRGGWTRSFPSSPAGSGAACRRSMGCSRTPMRTASSCASSTISSPLEIGRFTDGLAERPGQSTIRSNGIAWLDDAHQNDELEDDP